MTNKWLLSVGSFFVLGLITAFAWGESPVLMDELDTADLMVKSKTKAKATKNAPHHHHDGSHAVKHGPGKHVAKRAHGHTATVHVNKNKKVTHMTAHRDSTGHQVATKKVKSKIRRHAMADPSDDVFVSVGMPETDDSLLTALQPGGFGSNYVGFGFAIQMNGQTIWIFIWFPVNMVDGGDSGAVPYDPNNGNGGDDYPISVDPSLIVQNAPASHSPVSLALAPRQQPFLVSA
jgi:hypothetical protein